MDSLLRIFQHSSHPRHLACRGGFQASALLNAKRQVQQIVRNPETTSTRPSLQRLAIYSEIVRQIWLPTLLEAIQLPQQQPYPGNIRELRNTVVRSAAESSEKSIGVMAVRAALETASVEPEQTTTQHNCLSQQPNRAIFANLYTPCLAGVSIFLLENRTVRAHGQANCSRSELV